MTRDLVIKGIIERLNNIKAESRKEEFDPIDLDVDGSIQEFKIVECVNDERGRNKELKIGECYEVIMSYNFDYNLRGIRCCHSKEFFKAPEIVKIVCKGDYYELYNE